MIADLKKIQIKIFNQEICLYSPPKSEIVISDESHSKLVIDYILTGYSYFVYEMRPEKLYISPSIIFCFLKSFLYCFLNEIKTENRKKIETLRTVFAQKWHYYRLACFMVINPKIVISVVDNSGSFHWLSKNYKNAVFFAIQNGNRNNNQIAGKDKIYLQNFFCFGNYEKERYERFGHVVQNFYPIGSLWIGIHQKSIKKNTQIDYDVSVVSQYRKFIFNGTGDPYFKKPQILMHEMLSRYTKENNAKTAIIMNTDGHKDELAFFNNIYENNVDLLSNDRNILFSYGALYRSNVVVGFSSTLNSVAFGLGRKTLFIDFAESNGFNDYDPIILLKNPSYEELENRLNELLEEPYEDYRKRTKEYASHIMNYNPDCPPHVFIRNKIKEYL